MVQKPSRFILFVQSYTCLYNLIFTVFDKPCVDQYFEGIITIVVLETLTQYWLLIGKS